MTVLEKVSVSVTLVKTSHLRFLNCLQPTHLSKGYNLALTKQLLILLVILNETTGPGENTALASRLMYKIFKLSLIIRLRQFKKGGM